MAPAPAVAGVMEGHSGCAASVVGERGGHSGRAVAVEKGDHS
jgi:hypothetical protein